ncbi:MAG: hypothetical protein LBS43_09750, partial [Prevotellaceae bacterium]|nr:hypothetical protein [Prevotellaceae bacterium]
MKHIFLFTLISFLCNISISQNMNVIDYNEQWKKIDSLMEKGLYKSALDEVVKVHKHALANKDYAPAV